MRVAPAWPRTPSERMIFGMTLCGWAPMGRLPFGPPHDWTERGDWNTSATLFVANAMVDHFPHRRPITPEEP